MADGDRETTRTPEGDELARLRSRCEDLSLRVRELEQAADMLRAIVEATGDAVFVLDLDARVRTWNAASEQLYGWSAAEVLGKVFPGVPSDERAWLVANLRRAASSGRTSEVEVPALRRDGSRMTVLSMAAPLTDSDGLSVGVLVVARRVSSDSRLEHMQDRFVSLVSQQLKNPLTAILGYSQLLGRPEIAEDPTQRARTVRALESRVRQMAALVDDLMVASLVQDGQLMLRREPSDLPGILTDTVARLEEMQPGRRFVVEVDTAVPVADVDQPRIRQALTNLLSNAARHSPEGSQISISLLREGDEAVFSVTDAGPGISPDNVDRVFERFYTVEGVSGEGAGLGLYLVRVIAEAHGGTAAAHSELGHGATFELRLPLHG